MCTASANGVGQVAADNLLGLLIEDRETARFELVRPSEHGPSIIARRVGFRRRRPQFDGWVEEAVEEIGGSEPDAWQRHGTQGVTREHGDDRRTSFPPEPQGMARIRR